MRRLLLVLAAAVVPLCAAVPAGAHPLGNFTVNRYARVEVSAGVLRVHYVLDEAEIPAFQERDAVATDPIGFASTRAAETIRGLRISVDGAAATPALVGLPELSQPPGQGGLLTLRLAMTFEVALAGGPDDTHQAVFEDSNEADRIGWREIVVVPRSEARILSSDAPPTDASDELRTYPADLTRSPLDRRRASFSFKPGGSTAPPSPLTAAATAPVRSGGGFTGLVAHSGTALPILLGLAAAFGCLHALLPGHGKTVMAAYLVGTRGRPADAVALGVTVSLMHSLSVIGLGLVLLRVDRAVPADRIYPWLELAAGVAVTAVGVWLLVRRRRRSWRHDHEHHGHEHHHHESAPLSRRGLVALATSGGLFPSPSAVVVLVSAFSLHRAGLGLALVAAFSLGLAATLTAVGLALVYGRRLMEGSRVGRMAAWLPLAGAAGITLVGVVFVVRGLATVA